MGFFSGEPALLIPRYWWYCLRRCSPRPANGSIFFPSCNSVRSTTRIALMHGQAFHSSFSVTAVRSGSDILRSRTNSRSIIQQWRDASANGTPVAAFTTTATTNDDDSNHPANATGDPILNLVAATGVADFLMRDERLCMSHYQKGVGGKRESEKPVFSTYAYHIMNAAEDMLEVTVVDKKLPLSLLQQPEHASAVASIHRAFVVLVTSCLNFLEEATTTEKPLPSDNQEDERTEFIEAVWETVLHLTNRAHELQIPLTLPLDKRVLAVLPLCAKNTEEALDLVKYYASYLYDNIGVAAMEEVLQYVILHHWIPEKESSLMQPSIDGLVLASGTVEWTLNFGVITYWEGDWVLHVVLALRDRLLPYTDESCFADLSSASYGATLLRLVEPTLFRITQAKRGHCNSFVDSLRNYPNTLRRSEKQSVLTHNKDSKKEKDNASVKTVYSALEKVQWELTRELRLGVVSEWVEHWIHVTPSNSDDPSFDPSPPIPAVIELHISPDGSVDAPYGVASTHWASEQGLETVKLPMNKHLESWDLEDLYQPLDRAEESELLLPDLSEQWRKWEGHEGQLRYGTRLENIFLGRLLLR